jgi:hypothetical protein
MPEPSVELARRIYECSRLTGEFRLRSGATSGEYFDKYLFESDPLLLRDVAETLLALLSEDVDALAGLELGGVPLATVASQLSGIPTLFVRKQAKTYGTCRLAEGGEICKAYAPSPDLVPESGTCALRHHIAPSPQSEKSRAEQGFSEKRMKGLEPSTFCMASRRSSQLSYIRASGDYRGAGRRGLWPQPRRSQHSRQPLQSPVLK